MTFRYNDETFEGTPLEAFAHRRDGILWILDFPDKAYGKAWYFYDERSRVWVPTDSDACALNALMKGHCVFGSATVTNEEWRQANSDSD